MRLEKDFIGEIELEDHIEYGIQTFRALQNFSISHQKLNDYPILIMNMVQIKKAAATANYLAGSLTSNDCQAIVTACDELLTQQTYDQFPIDLYNAGGGVSVNMNINEVLSYRANRQSLHGKIHPNTHINMSQSTNDVFPSAIHLSIHTYSEALITQLEKLVVVFTNLEKEHAQTVKLGRTCLQDAVPITFGQGYSGQKVFVIRQIEKLRCIQNESLELVVGATAVGTSIGASAVYTSNFYSEISKNMALPIRCAPNYFDALQHADFYVNVSTILKNCASAFSKWSSDLRFLSSGPTSGITEISLPAVQPGSSIMPGKVNPCIPEMMMQISFDIFGKDTAISLAAERGELELNVWEMIITKNLFESFELLSNAIPLFIDKCLNHIVIHAERNEQHASKSAALSAVLTKQFGYVKALELTTLALKKNMTIKEVVIQQQLLDEQQANKQFNLKNFI